MTWILSRPGYQIHSKRLEQVVRTLPVVGAVTPAYLWMDNPPPAVPPGGLLSPAGAVRAATAVVRGERFADGTIADAARSGLIDAIAEALCTWYETEVAGRGRAS